MKFKLKIICIIIFTFTAQAQELKLEILNGHSGGGVLAVAVSSNGKFALTGSTDQTVLLWDLETGKQLRRFVGHEDSVSAVQFSKDGKYVLTASHDKTARLWETATGKQVRVFVENRGGVLIGHSGAILTCAISADIARRAAPSLKVMSGSMPTNRHGRIPVLREVICAAIHRRSRNACAVRWLLCIKSPPNRCWRGGAAMKRSTCCCVPFACPGRIVS